MRHEIDFGLGVLHLDVLRARLRRRRSLIRIIVVLFGLVIGLWAARPLLQGQGTLVLMNRPADAALLLDERPVTDAIVTALSGTHRVQMSRTNAYPIVQMVTISRNQTTTLELPNLRPRPVVQAIPLPAPGAAWSIASPDPAGGWRLTASGVDVQPTPPMGVRGGDAQSMKETILRLDSIGLARLSALEAYAAADEYIHEDGRSWGAWEPLRNDVRAEAGRLTISTPATSAIITTTAPITGLWWAPGGRQLLIAQQRGIGQDLNLWSTALPTDTLTTPIVTIPGHIVSVRWNPDGRGAVLLSTRPASALPSGGGATPHTLTWDATLLLPGTWPETSRAVRLTTPPPAPVGLIPMDWRTDALYWIVDTAEGPVLERIPFATALPQRLGSLPVGTIALRVLDDDQLRMLVREDSGVVTMRTWPAAEILFTLDDVPSAPDMGGMWSGDALLLATSADLWQLTFAPEALR